MSDEISNGLLKEILDVIRVQYGYDFSNYSQASFKRRLVHFSNHANVGVQDLKYHIVNDRFFFPGCCNL